MIVIRLGSVDYVSQIAFTLDFTFFLLLLNLMSHA
jgi:hypothetical protein